MKEEESIDQLVDRIRKALKLDQDHGKEAHLHAEKMADQARIDRDGDAFLFWSDVAELLRPRVYLGYSKKSISRS